MSIRVTRMGQHPNYYDRITADTETELRQATPPTEIARGFAVDTGATYEYIRGLGWRPSWVAAWTKTLPPQGSVGFNVYDALYAKFFGTTDDSNIWQYVVDSGAKIVRIMYPVFYSTDYTSYVFAAGVPARDFVDADFKSTFLSKSDALFDTVESYGIALHPSLFWTQSATTALNGETLATGFASTATATAAFMRRFAKWFAKRYGARKGLACYSLGNEWVYQESALSSPSSYPTAAQLGAVFADVAATIRSVDPTARVTADLTIPPVNVNISRQTLDNAIDCYRTIFKGLDFWTLHTYISGSNYVGRNTYQPGVEPAPNNTFGFEAVSGVIRLVSEAAASEGKDLVIGEVGVHTGEEDDTASLKKRRGVAGCAAHCRYVLIWNVQPAVRAATSGQNTWFIEPGTTRADTFKTLVSGLNKGQPLRKGSPLLGPRAAGPRACFTCARTAGTRITLTSFPKMVSTRYAFMAWVRVNAQLTAYETVCDFRSSTTAGFIVLGAATPGSWYAEFRRAAGNAGSTAGALPDLPIGKWTHLAVVYTPGAVNNVIDTYIDGVLWVSQVNANPMVGIPDATTLYVGGGTNGAPVSLQDVAVTPFASPDDIHRHMLGEVHPAAFLHIRTGDEGGIQDLSKYASALTVGGSVTTETLQ